MMSNKAKIIAPKNGRTPLNTVARVTFLATPRTTKTLRPTGGVIIPISITMTTMTPNQIGSKPRLMMTGNTIGIVMASIERPSMNMPKTTYAKRITASVP